MDLSRLIAFLGYGIALLGCIPLWPHLSLLPRMVFGIGLLLGLIAERRHTPLIPHRLLTIGTTLLFLWYAAQFSRHNPALPVVSMLMVLLGTRLAAEKNPRTWLQTCAIALFCLAASSLFDLGPRFLLFLGLMLPMIALQLVLNTFQAQGINVTLVPNGLRQAVAVGLLIPLSALLLTPLFFPILPRTQLPLWNFIQQAGGSQPAGLADTVKPGVSAQVPDSGQLVFRAEMPRIAANQLYWRAATFSRLDGLQWQRDGFGLPGDIRVAGNRLDQLITLEPGSSRLLIGLDTPLFFSYPNGATISNATWSRPLPSSRRLRYEVTSATGALIRTAPPSQRLLTGLPEATPPRLRQLAQQVIGAGRTEQQRLDALETWFRTAGFRYSRSDLPTGERALERFLFESRSGHCEFFASSFALLARTAGLPARLVGGYYGGDYNELGGYYRVTEERAHVWVEVWVSGSGWLRVDPSSFAVNADAALGERRQRSLFQRLRLMLDSLDHTWNTAVITYDFERQLTVATQIHARLTGFTVRDLRRLALPGLLLALLLVAVRLIPRLKNAGLFKRDVRLLRRFRREVERRYGIPRHEHLGLFDIAARTADPRVRRFAELYGGACYRDRALNNAEYRQLKALLKTGFSR